MVRLTMLKNFKQQYANYLALRHDIKLGLWLPIYCIENKCIYSFKKDNDYLWVANGFLCLGIYNHDEPKYDYLGIVFNFIIWYSLILPMIHKCLLENNHNLIRDYRSNVKSN